MVGNRRTLIADFLHKQETGKIMSIRSYEESESERQLKDELKMLLLLKGKRGEGAAVPTELLSPCGASATQTRRQNQEKTQSSSTQEAEKHMRTHLSQVTSWRRRCGATGCRGNTVQCVGWGEDKREEWSVLTLAS